MSDQISEKMARKIYDAACLAVELGGDGEDTFITNLRAAGLIKPSKLDEAREWVKQKSIYPTEPDNSSWEVGYVVGVRDTAERFEAAITEILEERE
jgi:hypothetical protein